MLEPMKAHVQSHYKEVQKMLRQPCMPKTTNELTATDVPWVDSPLKSDDERPMSANRHPELMSPADRHEDVMHSTSAVRPSRCMHATALLVVKQFQCSCILSVTQAKLQDGSKGNVCEFPTNEKAHATVCECAETQDMVQLECLQQQLQGLIEENMLWKSRCADLEAKTAAQLRDTELVCELVCVEIPAMWSLPICSPRARKDAAGNIISNNIAASAKYVTVWY